jgi:ribonuclease P protein component
VNRNFRLTQSTDIKRVRRSGRSYAHPLAVLVVLQDDGEKTRIGVTAGKAIGKAVQRNRAKRLLREALRPLLPRLEPGWKAIIIARNPILAADFSDIQNCIRQLFMRANLLVENDER